MKAIKNKIIKELEMLEKHISENENNELNIQQLERLAMALHYADKAEEIMHKEKTGNPKSY